MTNRLRQIIFGPNHRWWALSVAALATFMVTTDAGLLSISLPVIVAEFKTDIAMGGWLPSVYAVVTGSLYLPCGRLSDLFGRRRTLSAGFLIYTLTAMMAAFSQTMGQVIFFRGLQAAGSALMMANTFALVAALFSPAERGRAMGISGGMISALGFVVGPALGGLITYALGWRFVFYVSFCLGTVGLLGARLILFDEKAGAPAAKTNEPFDFLGTATFALSLTALLLALTAGQKGFWHTPLVRSELALAALSLVVFIWWESRTPHPLLDLGLFRIRMFAAGNLARLMSFVTVSMNQLLMPFFLQLGLGLDTLRAGLLLATASVGLGILSPFTGWLSDRIGARLLSSAGLALMGLSFLSLGFLDLGASSADIVLRLSLLGIGLGLFQTPINNSLMSSIPRDRLGVGSSFLSIVRSLGISIGVATASAIVSARLVAVTGQTSLDALRSAGPVRNGAVLLSAFMQGYRTTCLTAAFLCLLGALAAGMSESKTK
ncbi:MAG TPA: MFS transporter [Candidatus Binatia bacterium]|jgi:EmrB/QacA subfamily drug resistance transporter